MCSRFEIKASRYDLIARYGLTVPPVEPPSPVVRPTDRAITVEANGQAVVRRFGLAASWDAKPLLNARAETLADKPFFRRLLGNRCLVPVTAWFEWRKDGRARHINRIGPADGLLSLAALFDGEGFVILTCAPHQGIAHVHDRMPVVLPRNGEADWLAGAPLGAFTPYEGVTAEEEKGGQGDAAPRQPDLFD